MASTFEQLKNQPFNPKLLHYNKTYTDIASKLQLKKPKNLQSNSGRKSSQKPKIIQCLVIPTNWGAELRLAQIFLCVFFFFTFSLSWSLIFFSFFFTDLLFY